MARLPVAETTGGSPAGEQKMHFGFNDEQNAIRESVARFSADVLAPGYRERDRAGRIERQTIQQMGEMGFLGGELPSRFGGADLDCVTAGIIIEIGRASCRERG